MSKESYTEDLKAVKGMLAEMHKLTESIMFREGYEDGNDSIEDTEFGGDAPLSSMDGEVQETPEQTPEEMPAQDPKTAEEEGMEKLDNMGALDQIREITLKGMIKLCKNPEDGEYQALKKIFQMCDKAVQDKGEEGQQQVVK